MEWGLHDPITLPRVHLNGTSRRELIDQYEMALDAVRAALIAVRNAAPHMRDYYPMGNDAFFRAQREHNIRVSTLLTIERELEQIFTHLEDVEV
jgi:hypothetical protein